MRFRRVRRVRHPSPWELSFGGQWIESRTGSRGPKTRFYEYREPSLGVKLLLGDPSKPRGRPKTWPHWRRAMLASEVEILTRYGLPHACEFQMLPPEANEGARRQAAFSFLARSELPRATVLRGTALQVEDCEEVQDGRGRWDGRGPVGARPPRWRRRAHAPAPTADVGAPQAGRGAEAVAG